MMSTAMSAVVHRMPAGALGLTKDELLLLLLLELGVCASGWPTVYDGAAEKVEPVDTSVVLTVAALAPGRVVDETGR